MARPSILNSASLRWKDKGLIVAASTRDLRLRQRVAAQQQLDAIVSQKEMKNNCRPAGKSTKVNIAGGNLVKCFSSKDLFLVHR